MRFQRRCAAGCVRFVRPSYSVVDNFRPCALDPSLVYIETVRVAWASKNNTDDQTRCRRKLQLVVTCDPDVLLAVYRHACFAQKTQK